MCTVKSLIFAWVLLSRFSRGCYDRENKTRKYEMILCSVPWVEIRPSNAISRVTLKRFCPSFIVIQVPVKQNKIRWDKFIQIPANFEIISQQI
jgi:hypothetical protein